MVLARSRALTAVSTLLAVGLKQKDNTVRQRLREWCYEAQAKRGKKRQEVCVETCFAPLLGPSQGDLQRLRLVGGVSPQELMHGHIADDKRQSIEHFKAFLAQGTLLANPAHAQSRLVDQLQRHAWLYTGSGVARPTAQQVPGPQA
jgi:hypothetical protein